MRSRLAIYLNVTAVQTDVGLQTDDIHVELLWHRAPTYTAGLAAKCIDSGRPTSKTAKSKKGDTDVIDPSLIGTCSSDYFMCIRAVITKPSTINPQAYRIHAYTL